MTLEVYMPPGEYRARECVISGEPCIEIGCRCDASTACPQNKPFYSTRCYVWVPIKTFTREALAKLREPIRR